MAPRCSAPPPSPRVGCRAKAASAAFGPPRCSALASPRLARRAAQPHCLCLARRLPLRRLRRASRRRAAPRPSRLAWRRTTQLASLDAALLSTTAFAPRRPLRRLRRLSRRRAAPRSPRLAWHRFAQLHRLVASRVGCRYGGFGGFHAAALRRDRRASLNAAPLSTVAFALRVSFGFGGFGVFRAAALASPRLAPRCSAPSPSSRASATASAASAAFLLPLCAALASPRSWRHTARHHRLRLLRRPPRRRLWQLPRRRAAPRSPRLAVDAALLSSLTFASRVGRRFGGFGGFHAAALRRDRLAPLGAALLSTTSSPRASAAASAAPAAFAPPRCAALASPRFRLRAAQHHLLRLAPATSSPRASAAASAAPAAFAPPRCAALASPRFRLRAAQHHLLRLAPQLPLRRLWWPYRRRAAPRSPRLAWLRAARHRRIRLAHRLPL